MKTDYTRHYSKWHADTPEHRALMTAYYRRVFAESLPGDRSARILDVGCGMGFALLALKTMGYGSVYGIDSDQGQVSSCLDKGLEVCLSDDTAAYLNSRPSSFQAITALDLIEHIPCGEQLAFVAALATALQPAGVLICTVPNANSILAERWRYIDWTHQCSFTEHSLSHLLSAGGFSDLRVQPMEFIQRPPHAWLPRSGVRHWWAFRFFRFWRRLEMMAELGPTEGANVPLSLNLKAAVVKG